MGQTDDYSAWNRDHADASAATQTKMTLQTVPDCSCNASRSLNDGSYPDQMTLQTVPDCSCNASRALVDGSYPEYLKSPQEAAQRFIEHQLQYQADHSHCFWAVHINCQHIIGVI